MNKLSEIKAIGEMLNIAAKLQHELNHKWWHDLETGERIARNKGELIALMHSELSECLEGERKDLMDTHIPHRKMAEVELVDTIIRIFDYAGAHGYDIGGAFIDKTIYNMSRADHQAEQRKLQHGKKF